MKADRELEYLPKSYLGVMVSSTFADIREHRAEAIRILEERQMLPRVMEWDSAKPEDVIKSSLQMVHDSSAYIGVITHKYGQTPFCPDRNPNGLSLTELEFNEAQKLGRPTLLFIMGERHKGERADFEYDPDRLAKLVAFRERAKKASPSGAVDRVYATFESLEEFKDRVANAVANLAEFLAARLTQSSTHVVEFRSIDQQEPCPEIFGRDDELRLIADSLLSNGHVIIAGGPGFGKTALATKAMYDIRVTQKFEDRRLFVSYDSASEPREFLARIVESLGLSPAGDEPSLLRQIETTVAKASAAFVLDNLDTLLELSRADISRLLSLLQQMPGFVFVATVRGVTPAIPHVRAIEDLAKLDSAAALQTFLLVAGDEFRDDQNLEPLLGALDGHALSIQLLAAQARGSPSLAGLREIWEEEHAAILRRPGEDEGRLTSVRASLAISLRSKRLLSMPLARRLLALIAQLPAGISEDSVRAILGERGQITKARALEAVTTLHQLKLVERRLDLRLRMLNPIREAIKMDLSILPVDLKRLREHYIDIGGLGLSVGSIKWQEAEEVLEAEGGNLDVIFRSAVKQFAGSQKFHRALVGLSRYASSYGVSEISAVDAGIEIYKKLADFRKASVLLTEKADLHLYRGNLEIAYRLYTEAEILAKEGKAKSTRAEALFGRSSVELSWSETIKAATHLEEARELFVVDENKNGIANCVNKLAILVSFGPDETKAIGLFQEASKLYSEISSDLGIANVAVRLAMIEWQTAEERLQQALSAFRRTGARVSEAVCLLVMGENLLRRMEPEASIPLFLAAQQLAQLIGDLGEEAGAMVRRGQALRLVGQRTEGRELIAEGFSLWMLSRTKRDLAFDGWVFVRESLLAKDNDEAEAAREQARSAWAPIGRYDLIREWINLPEALEAAETR